MIPGSQRTACGQHGVHDLGRSAVSGRSTLRVGFSFWGFLGHGILDTPDGGRFWRRPIVDALIGAGYEVILLQANRDLGEAADALPYYWDRGFPDLDVLLAEWRWPLPGRNTTPCGTPGHTCDLHRQNELLDHYTAVGTATIIWDTDRQLPLGDPLRGRRHVAVCEPAILPAGGARSLLHPVPDVALDTADPQALASIRRDLPLAYVGNQYDRDEQFSQYFAPAAAQFRHRVAGKWPRTGQWPGLTFTGRCAFGEVQAIYRTALTTVLLLPGRYARAGHMTQRLFEAVLAGCLPLTPSPVPAAAPFTPSRLHVHDRTQVAERIEWAQRTAGSAEHAELIGDCLARLEPFRLSTWTARLADVISELTASSGTSP